MAALDTEMLRMDLGIIMCTERTDLSKALVRRILSPDPPVPNGASALVAALFGSR